MFGRSKPATISPSSGMPSWARMSARVCASAVAVSASRGTSGKRVEQRPQQPVVGAEIMPPFGDAMRLVDREQRRAVLRRAAGGSLRSMPVRARHRAGRARRRGSRVDRLVAILVGGGQRRRADADRLGGAQLVVHQRDQRRDDHAGARPRAAPGPGSRATCPRPSASPPACAARHHALDHLPLHAAEIGKAECFFQNGERVGHR